MEMYLKEFEDAKADLVRRISSHPFLARCRRGDVSLGELKLFLVQQGIYSSYFTRYLCALMANLSNTTEVLKLASNLCEELGLIDDSDAPHSLVYRGMLEHFDLTIEGAEPLIGTRRLIDAMFDHCRHPQSARGLAALCLGAEALVPVIYADIIQGFEHQGVDTSALAFFHIHVACDDGHAEIIRDVMVDIAQQDPSQVPAMLSAGYALLDARVAFFSSIEARFEKCPTRAVANVKSVLQEA